MKPPIPYLHDKITVESFGTPWIWSYSFFFFFFWLKCIIICKWLKSKVFHTVWILRFPLLSQFPIVTLKRSLDYHLQQQQLLRRMRMKNYGILCFTSANTATEWAGRCWLCWYTEDLQVYDWKAKVYNNELSVKVPAGVQTAAARTLFFWSYWWFNVA